MWKLSWQKNGQISAIFFLQIWWSPLFLTRDPNCLFFWQPESLYYTISILNIFIFNHRNVCHCFTAARSVILGHWHTSHIPTIVEWIQEMFYLVRIEDFCRRTHKIHQFVATLDVLLGLPYFFLTNFLTWPWWPAFCRLWAMTFLFLLFILLSFHSSTFLFAASVSLCLSLLQCAGLAEFALFMGKC